VGSQGGADGALAQFVALAIIARLDADRGLSHQAPAGGVGWLGHGRGVGEGQGAAGIAAGERCIAVTQQGREGPLAGADLALQALLQPLAVTGEIRPDIGLLGEGRGRGDGKTEDEGETGEEGHDSVSGKAADGTRMAAAGVDAMT